MENKNNLEESFNLSELILLYISKNEPLDESKAKELLSKSRVDSQRFWLNFDRLKNAGFIDKGIIANYNHNRRIISPFALTYAGMEEINKLLKRKQGIKEIEVNIGFLKFKI